ncbi:MAG: CheY-like chemotaxis protein [Gammaproteobacteria bacterium]
MNCPCRPRRISHPDYRYRIHRNDPLLIVDDSTDNQLLLQAFLRNQPLELHFAEDGVEAVEAAKPRAFDLILMDMYMPRMNGIEATETIRKIEAGDTERTAARILAMTADDSITCHNRSLAAGCDEHLVKPVSKKNLLQALDRTSSTRELVVPQ